MLRRAHLLAFIALLVLSLAGHSRHMGGHTVEQAIQTAELASYGLSLADICGDGETSGHLMCDGCAGCAAFASLRNRGVLPPSPGPQAAQLPVQWTLPANPQGHHPAQPRGPPVATV